jgi:hypothetical protein
MDQISKCRQKKNITKHSFSNEYDYKDQSITRDIEMRAIFIGSTNHRCVKNLSVNLRQKV